MSAPENPSAFPLPDHYSHDGIGLSQGSPGMTLRDWFAGQIANGMAAHSGTEGGNFGPGEIAQRSYEIADAMLAARALASHGEG